MIFQKVILGLFLFASNSAVKSASYRVLAGKGKSMLSKRRRMMHRFNQNYDANGQETASNQKPFDQQAATVVTAESATADAAPLPMMRFQRHATADAPVIAAHGSTQMHDANFQFNPPYDQAPASPLQAASVPQIATIHAASTLPVMQIRIHPTADAPVITTYGSTQIQYSDIGTITSDMIILQVWQPITNELGQAYLISKDNPSLLDLCTAMKNEGQYLMGVDGLRYDTGIVAKDGSVVSQHITTKISDIRANWSDESQPIRIRFTPNNALKYTGYEFIPPHAATPVHITKPAHPVIAPGGSTYTPGHSLKHYGS